MTTSATMRAIDGTRGAVRVEDLYDTDIDDLWQACTTPERLGRWIARVDGDLEVGGTVQVVFTSTWTGPVRVEVCDAPHHLLLTTEPGTDDEGQIAAWRAGRTGYPVVDAAMRQLTQTGWMDFAFTAEELYQRARVEHTIKPAASGGSPATF